MSKVVFSIIVVAVTFVICFLVGILPQSPFLAYIGWSDLSNYLGYINYFLPIDKIIVISEAWLLAIAPWILAQLSIKAIKVLGEYIPL